VSPKLFWQSPILVFQHIVCHLIALNDDMNSFPFLIVLCSLLLYGTIFYAFATAIWTFSFAAPYLALAPIHNPRVERCVVIPAVEAVTTFLWLAVLIAQAYTLQSPMQYTLGGYRASLGAVVLAALEWYVLEFSINFCSPVAFTIKLNNGEVEDADIYLLFRALFVLTSIESFRIATQKNDVTDYFAMLPYH
jgi:hypothetical protein